MRRTQWFMAGLALLAVGQLCSCAANMTTAPTHALPAPVITASCPHMKDYTAAQSRALGSALAALPADNPLVAAMADYGQLRAEVRACHA